MLKALLTGLLLFFSYSVFAVGGTVTASATGNWNSAATWTNVNINRTGTVSATTTSTIVTGSGTAFLTEVAVGSVITRQTGTAIGTVASIQSNTQLTLTANSSSTTSGTYRTTDGPPAPDDALVINNNITLTMNVSGTYAVASLTINSGNQLSALTINSGVTLDVNGTITYGAGTGSGDDKRITVNGALEANAISMVNTGGTDRQCELIINTGAEVTVNGNIQMTDPVTENYIDLNGTAILNVTGNINNGAGAAGGGFLAAVSSTSTINLNGSSAQTVFLYGGNSALGIVKINNAAGVTFGHATTLTTLTIGDETANSVFSDGGNQVTSTGTLNLTSGTFELGATAATTFPAFTTRNISSGTFVEYAANATQTVSTTPSYQHLSFSGSGTKNLATGTLTVAGNWAVGSATTLVNAQTYNVSGNITGSSAITSGTTSVINIGGNWTNTGNFVPSTGTVNFNGSAAQSFTPAASEVFNIVKINNSHASGVALGAAITVSTLTIGDVTSTIFSDNGNQLTSTGTLNLTSGTFKLGTSGTATTFPAFATNTISSGTTVEYASGQSQTVSTTPSYHHLSFSGSGTKTVSSGTLSVAGNWSVESATALNTNNPTVNVTGNITGAGSITSTSGTLSIGGSWTNNGTFTHNSGTVNYNNASGGQTIAGLLYRNLTLSNTSGTNTAGADITTINLTISNAGATLNMSTFALSVSGSTPNEGTIRTQHTSTTEPITSGLSWNCSVEYDAASGTQTVVTGTYENLKSNNSSGTNTAGGDITVNGPLTVASGGTLDMVGFALSGSSFSTSGAGTIKTQNSTSTPLPSGATWAPAVEYNRSSDGGNQTVVSGSYGTLTASGAGTKTMAGNVTVTGALTMNAVTLAVSSNTINIQTNSVTNSNGGALNVTAGSVVFNFNNTLNLGNSFFSGGVSTMTISGGATVNLPATPVAQSVTNLDLSNGKLGLGTSARLILLGTVSNMSATNCIVGNATGSIAIGGSGALGTLYFDQTTPGTTNTINEFTISRTNLSGTLTIGNTLRIKTLLTPNFGTVTSNGNLVIGSDANGTARIYPAINASNFAFVGAVKVERYSKNKNMRRFLFMSSVVDNISVRDAWQDDIFITGVGTGGTVCGSGTGNGGTGDKYNSNGFDVTTQNVVTMYSYDQNNAARWVAIPTTSYTLQKGRGYRVLYRGARGTNDANCADYLMLNSPSAPSAATLNVSGTMIQGSFSVTVDGPTTGTYGYTLLGNPYACELEFDKFVTDNSSVIAPTYWTYDPNGTTNNTAYISYTTSPPDAAGVYHSDPGGNPDNFANPGFIAAGQAFFVQADATNLVTFNESQKANITQNGLFKTQTLQSKIRVHFRQFDNTPIDNILIRFSNDPAVTTAENKKWDVVTLNSGNFLASIKGTRSFAIQTRPVNFFNDTVQLRVVSSTTGNFKLEFTTFVNFVEAAQIILIDQFTGTQTDVKMNPVYPFTITSSPSSQAGRFKLVFRSYSSLLPLSYLHISATQKAQGIEVAWKVAFEQGVQRYMVERSDNGTDFTVIGNVDSKGNSNTPVEYFYMDTKPLKGTAYYRVKSVEAGNGSYSAIVKVNSAIGQPGLFTSPNPVKDKLRLTLKDNAGFEKATLVVTNTLGKTIIQSSNIAVNNYMLDVSSLAPGMYIITLVNNNGERLIEKFVKY